MLLSPNIRLEKAMGKRVLGGTLRYTLQAIHCCASQYSS